MKYTLILLLTVVTFGLNAQKVDYSHYKPLKSYGQIPDDFRSFSKEKFEASLVDMTEEQKESLTGLKDKYIISTSNSVNSLLMSGFVTFNDPISIYANKVLKHVLKEDKELLSKVRVYLSKSTNANAVSFNNGVILVTVGLIAQLQNEAQLAYILAHEAMHYQNGHHIKGFLNREKVKTFESNLSYSDKVSSLFSYSREQELEADKIAFSKYYKKSGYSIKEAVTLFDVLLYSYLPFDEIEFDYNTFENKFYKFPDMFKMEQTSEISAIDNYEDNSSTHPNILKRKKYVERMVAEEEDGGKDYIISEIDFIETRKNARFELSYLYRLENSFEKAIYNSFLLLREYPKNKYLETNIGESLYGLNFYKNRGNYYNAHVKYRNIEGFSQQVNYFFHKIKKEDLNILTLRYLWNLHTRYEDDKYITALTDSTISDVANYFKHDISDFPTKEEKIAKDSISTEEYNAMSKTEKIKYNKQVNTDHSYYYNALVGAKHTFDLFEKYDKQIIKKTSEENMSYDELLEKRKKEKKIADRERKYGKSLGIDSLFVLNPYLEVTSEDLSSITKIKKLYKNKAKFIAGIDKSVEKLKLSLTSVDFSNLNENDIEKFNKFSLAKMWMYENYFQEDNDFIMASKKYLTDSYTQNSIKHIASIGITYKYNEPVYFLNVYEIETGQRLMHYRKNMSSLSTGLINSNVYYSLSQVKRSK